MDRRVRKSKTAIKNAVINLMTEKDINEITISEIAEKAGINRKTFYNCYEGFRDVLDEIDDDITSDFEKIMENVNFTEDGFNTMTFYESLAMLINGDIDFYEAVLNAKDRKFTVKAVGRLSSLFAEKIGAAKDVGAAEAETASLFLTAGILAVFQNWLTSGREASVAGLASTVDSLIRGAVYMLNGENFAV